MNTVRLTRHVLSFTAT